jgi:SAM-dependent methyltransferase
VSPNLWAGGRYESVAQRIRPVAEQTVATLGSRLTLPGASLVDLACGTGSAALAAAARGARVTGVDLTPELIDLGRHAAGGQDVTWVTADAADTGLTAGAFDAVVSNMGIIFVDPDRQVPELGRLLRPAGVLAFSSWRRDVDNPFFDPIVAVFGAPPSRGFSPDQWGDPAVVRERLAADFTDVEIEDGALTWAFDSVEAAMHFLEHESPMHVELFAHIDDSQRLRLRDAFVDAIRAHETADGVAFEASYAITTAVRRT